METKDIINIITILLSPAIAVGITLAYQYFTEKRKDKRSQKMKLYLDLMAHRKLNFPSQQYADALNLIEVVFYNNPTVITYWHTYSDYLRRKPYNPTDANNSRLDLLAEMGKVLGYKNLQQTKIDNFYVPNAHNWANASQDEIQHELLRVLKSSHSFSETNKATQQPFDPEQEGIVIH